MTKTVSIPFQNTKIKGNLHVNRKSKILVIICHGFGDSKDEPNVKRFTELLSNHTNVFRFTFTDNDKPFLPIEKENIETVVDFFSKKFEEIIILGVSLGGLSTILSVSGNNKIKRLILVNPFTYVFKKVAWKYRKMLISMFLAYPFIKEVRDNLNFYFKNLKPRLIKIPTLVIVALNDLKVGPIHGKKLFNNLGSLEKKLILDKEIDHGVTKESYKKIVIGYINNWLEK
jgi:esterase/lipase